FKDLSIHDIYQIRLALEPELAASLAGQVNAEDLTRLRASLHSYAEPAQNLDSERQQHIDSLAFHDELAQPSGGNPLLVFIIRFTAQTLADLTVYRRLYEPGDHHLGPAGCQYHAQVLDAIEDGDADRARRLMHEHLLDAQAVMNDNEVQVKRGFLSEKEPKREGRQARKNPGQESPKRKSPPAMEGRQETASTLGWPPPRPQH